MSVANSLVVGGDKVHLVFKLTIVPSPKDLVVCFLQD